MGSRDGMDQKAESRCGNADVDGGDEHGSGMFVKEEKGEKAAV
jgi:hypothetical protein